MEQRVLRLGDIVDDYCPRERRITNHAIVAIVENVIRQTRCSTCEAEHEYKEAKVPRKKTKGSDQADSANGVLVTPKPVETPAETPPQIAAAPQSEEQPAETSETTPSLDAPAPTASEEPRHDAWLHRPLIRATLPRTDGEPPQPRPIPEFTMHQRQGRGFGRRDFKGFGNNGNPHFRNPNQQNGNEPDGNRAPQPGRPGGGGGRRRRRRRR